MALDIADCNPCTARAPRQESIFTVMFLFSSRLGVAITSTGFPTYRRMRISYEGWGFAIYQQAESSLLGNVRTGRIQWSGRSSRRHDFARRGAQRKRARCGAKRTGAARRGGWATRHLFLTLVTLSIRRESRRLIPPFVCIYTETGLDGRYLRLLRRPVVIVSIGFAPLPFAGSYRRRHPCQGDGRRGGRPLVYIRRFWLFRKFRLVKWGNGGPGSL